MKRNNGLVVIIVILLMVIALMIGWYLGSNYGDKQQQVINNNDTKETQTATNSNTSKEDLSSYPEWMQYILQSDIKSISIYKWMNEKDKDYKENKNSLYKIEITRDDLKEILNSMKNAKMKVVVGRGGNADYLRISYVSNNKDYDLDFRQNYIDYNAEDDELTQLLTKENTDIVNNMSEDLKEIFGSNPIPNFIEWDYTILDNYFNTNNVTTYYYDK